MRKRLGFTLMEMLIVVAGIGILVAIAIPTFSASLERSREAACAANRRSLKGLLSTAWMLEGQEGYSREKDAHRGEYTCPSGGEFTITLDAASGAVTVSCNLHTDSADSLGDAGTLEKVLSTIEGNRGSSTIVDSAAIADESSFSTAVAKALREADLNLTAMDAATWQYRSYGSYTHFYWSPLAADSLSAGDTVPVLRYNSKTGNYTVWLARMERRARPGGGGQTYLALPQQDTGYKKYTADGALDQDGFPQTYENARQWLEQALATYG